MAINPESSLNQTCAKCRSVLFQKNSASKKKSCAHQGRLIWACPRLDGRKNGLGGVAGQDRPKVPDGRGDYQYGGAIVGEGGEDSSSGRVENGTGRHHGDS